MWWESTLLHLDCGTHLCTSTRSVVLLLIYYFTRWRQFKWLSYDFLHVISVILQTETCGEILPAISISIPIMHYRSGEITTDELREYHFEMTLGKTQLTPISSSSDWRIIVIFWFSWKQHQFRASVQVVPEISDYILSPNTQLSW